MIALDTNVVVRLLVADDAAQTAKVAKVVGRSADAGLFVSDVVMCETVWVLSSAYELPRADITAALRQMLHARQFAFDDADLIARALDVFDSGRGDFADYVIRERALRSGCDAVLTFDRALLKEPGFRSP